jgi:amino acid adenylation domain-containing protein
MHEASQLNRVTNRRADLASLPEVLRQRAGATPDRISHTFLGDGEEEQDRLSYAGLHERALAIAAALTDRCTPGARVLLLYPPGLDFLAAFFGCLYAGMTAVPAYPPRSPRMMPRLLAVLHDARPEAALALSAALPRIRGWMERTAEGSALAWIATDVLEPSPSGWLPAPPDGDSIAFLQYTSGSTSAPKGVMVTHANLAHNQRVIQEACGHSEQSVFVSWLPPYHDLGLIGNLLQAVWVGAPCVLMAPVAFLQSPVRWLRAVSRYRATTSGGPNFAYDLCVRKIPEKEREGLDLSSWTVAFNGAEPVRAGTLDRFAAAFAPAGFRRAAFYPCYGLAEATLMVSGNRPGEGPWVRGSSNPIVGCGRVLPGFEAVIVDPATAAPCAPGEVGEIWLAGGSVARGYWNRPRESAETFGARLSGDAADRGPYLRTGDLGSLEGEQLCVAGRIKDLVILRGRNHYPQDLELTAERSHPALRPGGGAAFAVERDGEERLVLVHEAERHTGDPQAIAAAVRTAIAAEHEALVHDVVLVPPGGVPKTTSGKVQRRACRELYLTDGLTVLGRSALPADAGEEPAVAGGGEGALREALPATPAAEREALLESWLRSTFARLARVDAAAVDADQPLARHGLDSLLAIELKNAVEAELGADLPIAALLEGLTLRAAARLLLSQGEDSPSPGGRERDGRGGQGVRVPLSWNQRSLWVLHRLAPDSAAYHISGAARLPGGIDPEKLRQALQALVDRHAVLRTAYEERPERPEGPVQRIAERQTVAFEHADASEWSEEELQRRIRDAAFRPFDLARGPVFRAALLTGGPAPCLVVSVHHIAADLWSLAVLVRELGILYGEEADRLPETEASYLDFVRWQEEMLAGPRGEQLAEHWRRRLAGAPPLELPADHPRPAVQSFRGVTRTLSLEPGLAAAVEALARERDCTPFMALLAAFQTFLARISGQDDFLLGSPTSGRGAARWAGVVGYFVDLLALRADLAGDPTGDELLARARREALDAFAHQDYPFALLAERLQPERPAGQLLQAALSWEKSPTPELAGLAAFALGEAGARLSLHGLELESIALPHPGAQRDLTLLAAELDGRLLLSLEADADLFDGVTAERLLGCFATLLRNLAAAPERRVAELPMLGEPERQAILFEWNATAAEVPRATVHELVEARAEAAPEAPALCGDEGSTTYGELVRRAWGLAQWLLDRGLRSEEVVGVCLERSPGMVTAALGVLAAGGAYLPLHPAHPPERLSSMLADAGARFVLTREGLAGRLRGAAAEPVLVETLTLEQATRPPRRAHPKGGPDSLAYVIYTSGSTGAPKGSALGHAGLVNLATWNRETFGVVPADRMAQVAAPGFDAAVWEIWSCLTAGATLLFPPDAVIASPPDLWSWVAANGVTLCFLPTPLMDLALGEGVPPGLPLRWLFAGGDRLQRRPPPGYRLGNLYGPTEATVITVASVVSPEGARPPSIGRPVANTRAYVLDAALSPVPPGVTGELFVAGAGLGRGYLGRPDLTAAAFLPDPFGDRGERLYRTGDLARRLPDGRIECLGRADHQVKIRGFRVEPGEVEAALAALPGVREAAVVVHEATREDRRLVAWVVPEIAETAADASALCTALARRLPAHMVPSAAGFLPALPRNASGKVDRRELAVRPMPADASGEGYEAPRTPAEELIAAIWADLLATERIGLRDHFFERGGHSLLASRAMARLREPFGVELPLRTLFENPTLGSFAAAVDRAWRQRSGDVPPVPQMSAIPRPVEIPLSFAQERLWVLDRLAPGQAVYNIPLALRLRGPVSPGRLAAALAAVADRHETLRTRFPEIAGRPVQAISSPAGPAPRVPLAVLDLSGLPAAVRPAEAMRRAVEEARCPFDLAAGPLCRATLFRLDGEEHLFLLQLHHIIFDGWSTGVLLREVGLFYAGDRIAPPLPVQYADFALWQRAWLEGGALAAQLDAWRERLAGAPTALDLPADRPRPAVQTFRGGAEAVTLEADLARALRAAGRRGGTTLFMTVLAGWASLLHRSSGAPEMLVGTPVANRRQPELGELIGLFVNTLPLRIDLAGDPPFAELLGRVRETALAAYENQDVPFERLVEAVETERDLSRSPLFQTLLALADGAPPALRLPGVTAEEAPLHNGTAKLELTLALNRREDDLSGGIEFNADLFDAATVRRLAGQLLRLLAGAATAPEARLSELPLLSEPEIHQLRHEWNAGHAPAPIAGHGADLCRRFEAWARLAPQAAAVSGDRILSYADLNARADRLASHLIRLGVRAETRVGICLERSLDLVVAALGVLKAGGAYIPLDPGSPDDRLHFMVRDALGSAEMAVLLTRNEWAGRFTAAGLDALHIVDLDGEEWLRESPRSLKIEPAAGNLAYVIYTSGSTGRPKGVEVSRGALASLVSWHVRAFGVGPDDRATLLAGVGFDAAAWELFPYLSSGASVHVVPEEVRAAPAALQDWLAANRITIAFLPTVLAEELAGLEPPGDTPLRYLLTGGDRLLVRPRAGLPFVLINNYGPTENTVVTTSGRVEPDGKAGRAPSLGRPIDGVEVFVLDRHLRPEPPGAAGELCIGGGSLARGYLGRPDLTAERFVPHALAAAVGARLYRTGDAARWNAAGEVEFLGRLDRQVKIRGVRIEPGEIEAALLALPGVRQAAVEARGGRLVGWVVLHRTDPTDRSDAKAALSSRLRETLPDSMVPSAWVLLPALPLTPNGKVDRKALPAPETAVAGDFVAPRTPTEEVLAGIWSEILGQAPVGIHDSFFELGGHSLLAARVVSRLRDVFGVELPLRALFERPTVEGLAAAVEEARGSAGVAAPPLVRAPRPDGLLPLSFAQERLWVLDCMEPGTAVYNLPTPLRLAGPLDAVALEAALDAIVRRHEALRTTFAARGGRPAQIIAPPAGFPLPRVDLAALPAPVREEELARLLAAEARRPFDLERGPLLRAALLRLSAEDHALALTAHHIVFDGGSAEVLMREMDLLYAAFAAGRPAPLPELPVQYADWALWQRESLHGETLAAHLAFWRGRLEGVPPLDLPADRPRPPIQTSRGAEARIALPAELTGRLEALARREGATLFMALLAAFQGLLCRLSAQTDFAVGSPVANRGHRETEELIGFFANTLALRANLSGDPTFRELLGRVRAVTLEAFAHEDLPFEKLVAELQPERDRSRPPLAQVFCSLQNRPALRLGGLGVEVPDADTAETGTGTARVDLTLVWHRDGGALRGTLEHNTDLFGHATARRLLERQTALLQAALTDPDRRLSDLPLLAAAERAQLLAERSGARAPYPAEEAVPELFAAQARRQPEAPAVEFGDLRWTYAELAERARQLAAHLRRLGVTPGDRVGLALERSAGLVAAMLGTLEAGAAYVPLDPTYPPERLAWMREDAGLAAVVTPDELEAMSEGAERSGGRPVRMPAGSPAYILYTSGSTGQPKGVIVPHRAIARLILGTDYVRLGPADRVAQVANASFDAATFEVWGALLTGGCVVGLDREVTLSPERFAGELAERRITAMFLTVSLFNQVARQVPGAFRGLRHLLVGGEAVDPGPVRTVLADRPPERLLNGYGPTESTTFAVWHLIGEVPPGAASVPIGRALANTRTYVADPALHLAPDGIPGELLLGGDGLALGYWRRPDLTAERFVPHPWSDRPGERLYRTGDLMRWNGGVLDLLRRIDQQVKIRGFRIEPGEIEAALLDHPAVAACAVVPRQDAPGDRRLTAYLVLAAPRAEADPAELRAFLAARLPAHLVPAAFATLPALPLTPNGKADRQALLRLPAPASEAGGSTAPRTPLEEVVAGIWCEVLGIERVGAHDNFFAAGGHSLLATQVTAHLRQALGIELAVGVLFEAPTVAELAGVVAERLAARSGTAATASAILPRRPGLASLPMSFSQERLWFLDRLDPGSPTFNLPAAVELRGDLDPAALAAALAEVVRRHESLRTTFADADGVPVQRIALSGEIPLPRIDLATLPQEARLREAARLASADAARRFDLARGPLFAATLLRLEERRHHLLLAMHHIVSDGWSLGVLIREVAALYGAFLAGKPSPLPEPAVQYADYALWQRENSAGREQDLAWWSERLADATAPLDLPTDRPRPPVQTWRGGWVSRTVPAGLSTALRSFGRREGATLFMTLLAGAQALLHRLAGRDDVVVGSPIAGRRMAETEPLIGFFVNLLALRTEVSGNPGFRELVARVREVTLGAYAHQDLPFEALLARLQPERDLSRTPVFQVLFNMLNLPARALRLPGLEIEEISLPDLPSKFDLTFYVNDGNDGNGAPGQGIAIKLAYNADLFDAARMEELLDQLELLLAAGVDDPQAGVDGIPLAATPRARAILPDPAAELSAAWEGAVHEVFARHARRTPGALAVADPAESWTYGELDERADRLAAWLSGAGVGPGDVVAFWAHRSAPLVWGVLGALKAGAAFLMLDPHHPAPRQVQMLALARPAAWLRVAAAGPVPAEIEQALDAAGCACRLELPARAQDSGFLSGVPAVPSPAEVGPDSVAYVAFTSGSTGVPKGVLGRHGSLSHFIPWLCRRFELSAADRYSMLSGLAHDPLHRDLFTPLQTGAAVVIPDPETMDEPGRLAAWMRREAVTVAHLTPALGQVLTTEPAHGLPVEVPSLRYVFLVGDVLTRRDVARLRRLAPQVTCVNYYGSTETQRAVGYHMAEEDGPREVLPLGRGIPDVQLLILSRAGGAGCLAGIGEIGEIWVRSPHIALGYLSDPQLTAERFVADRYRTGDLGRYLPDGEAVFAGRADTQVKIRGFRIELGEIESVLGGFPGVREAVVVARQARRDGGGESYLAAYVVPAAGAAPAVRELRSFLRERLPDAMVPTAFTLLDHLPLTPNRKVDRKALPEPDRGERPEDTAFAAPETGLEREIAAAWREVLDREPVGADDNFFDLGGHSLLLVRLHVRLEQILRREIPLLDLFAHPTVRSQAAHLGRTEEERGGAGEAMLAVERRPPSAPAVLSFGQERLWFLDQLDPGSPASNIPSANRLEGPLDEAALESALSEVVRRHEALRTTFPPVAGAPVPRVSPPSPVVLPRVDLSALPSPGISETEALRLAAEESLRPFDLARGPLLRAVLVRLDARDHLLLVNQHHIVSDGWSLGIFQRELAALYEAFAAGAPSPLAEPAVQYADFAAWQRRRLSGPVLESRLAWWRERLTPPPPVLELPTDRPRPAVESFRGGRQPLTVPAELTAALTALGRERGATLFMTLLAGFQALLGRLTGQDDLAVGTPVAGRSRVEVEDLIGLFINTLVLRTDLGGDPTFGETLARVRETALGAYAHQELPFERLVQELRPERALGHSPLFQVLFILQNVPSGEVAASGLTLRRLDVHHGVSRFDLTLSVTENGESGESGGGLLGYLEYKTDLLDAATAARWLGHLGTLLAGAAAAPDRRLSELPLLTGAERRQILVDGNDTATEIPAVCAHHLIAGRAARSPEEVAAVCENERLTRAQLEDRAARLAGRLRALGVGPESLVGISLERSLDLLVAVLGVWKAGGAYLPLDPAYPAERIGFMLADSGVKVVLTHERLAAALPNDLGDGACVHCLDREPVTETEVDPLHDGGAGPDHLAYVLYTSGSTGRPKGVQVTHGALLNFLLSMRERPGIGAEDVLVAVTSLSFDIAGLELYLPLLAGARLVVATRDEAQDGARLAGLLESSDATILQATPATWRLLLAGGWRGTPGLKALCGGEALPEDLAAALLERSPEVWNLYGPTETTIWSTVSQVLPRRAVSIGRPIANTTAYLLDAHGAPAPLGVPGALLLGGAGVARGYLGRPDLTAERFVPDPFSAAPGARLYRTGDLARRRTTDGALEYLGRADQQVKIRGHRIEPGEVEAALARHSSVAEAAVGAHGDRLVAWVVLHSTEQTDPKSVLSSWLREKLPDYMVPSAWVFLDALPLTPNRKVDRRSLPAPPASGALATAAATAGAFTAPRNPVEEALAGVWAQVLGLDRVGVDDDFFALGGHSILATALLHRVRGELGADLPLRTLFAAPTVAGMAAAVASAAPALSAAPPRIVPDRDGRHQPFPLTDVQEAYWIGRSAGMELGSVATHLYFEIDTSGLDVDRFEQALRLLIDRHGMLRAIVQPDGQQRILAEVPPCAVARQDLRAEGVDAGEALAALRERMSHQVLPSDRWPLFEIAASLLPAGRERETRVRLHVSLDLLIADAWSLRLLARDLGRLYERPGEPLPELEISFRDYVLAEAALRETEGWRRSLEAWRGRLADFPPPPALPLARNPATVSVPRFVRRQGEMTAEAWALLKRRAAAAGLTPSGALLAAWSEVLAAWSGGSRFTLNLTLFNRLPLHPQVSQLVGDFTSLTLLAVEHLPGEPFVDGARRLQQRLWDDLDHRLVSGVRVLRELSRLRGEPRTIMPVVFTSTLNQAAAEPAEAAGLGTRAESGWAISQTPQVWLDHQVVETGGALSWRWDAVEELFPPGLLDDMFAAYSRLLERLAGDEAAWREPVRGLLPAEQLRLIAEANSPRALLPQGLLHEPFLERARLTPEAPAVITSSRVLTYGEIDRLSLGLSRRLRRLGAGRNRLVAVVMHKGWEQVAAVLAVLRAGAAYLPVDARLPAERLRHLLVRGEVAVALTQPGLEGTLAWPAGVERVVVESSGEKDIKDLRDIKDGKDEGGVEDSARGAGDLAYVIFTSGSTGEPKGVMIDHRGALNTVVDVNRRFGVGPGDRVLALSSLSFDLSVWDIFGVLAAGGALVIPDAGSERDPAHWAELAAREKVTVWNTVPALMEMLVEHGAGRPAALGAPLRLALLSGDWIAPRLPERIRGAFPGAQVISLGGATEASIWSILYPVGEVGEGWASIPYGRAMANQSVLVLDEDLEPRPVWVPGQLYIGGAGLALGYWRDAEKTHSAFLRHPRTGERLYRTGDLGRLLPSRDIELLGRDDTQVKIQGHRIELGEVEAALARHPRVAAAVVSAVGERNGPKQLVAYVVAKPAAVIPAGQTPSTLLADPLERLRFKLAHHGQRPDEGRPAVELRRPQLSPDEVESLYLRRRSFRTFLREPIPLDELADFLACLLPVEIAGAPFPKHRYGSAGNLYPVQTWLLVKASRVDGLAGGIYYHDPQGHRLVLISSADGLDASLWDPANRAVFEEAAFAVFLIARLAAIAPLYGERARHFATLEAGLMTQLLETAAPDHRIGLSQMGGVRFEAVRRRFALDESCELVHTLVGGRIGAAQTGRAAFLAEQAEQQALLRLLDEHPRESPIAALEPTAPRPAADLAADLTAELREHLRSCLPEPLVPALWVQLDALPLSANGKVDRKALPLPARERSETGPAAAWTAPESEIEKILAGIIAEVLGVSRLGLHDNFFDLGASSVHIVRVHNALRDALGSLEIPIVDMFNHPSVSLLARRLAQLSPAAVPAGDSAPDPGAERSERLREGKDWRRQRLEKRRAAGGL